MSNHTTYVLNKDVATQIDQAMEKRPDLLYTTRSEFIKDAIRQHVSKLLRGES